MHFYIVKGHENRLEHSYHGDTRRLFKPQAPQGQEGTDGAVAEKRPPKKAERGKEEGAMERRRGKEERQKANRIKRARGDKKGDARPREPYTTTPRELPPNHGNSRVTAPKAALC